MTRNMDAVPDVESLLDNIECELRQLDASDHRKIENIAHKMGWLWRYSEYQQQQAIVEDDNVVYYPFNSLHEATPAEAFYQYDEYT